MRSRARGGPEHVAVTWSVPRVWTNVTGHLTNMFNNTQTPPCSRLMRSFVCPLHFYLPQTPPRGALEGYLYPATFSRVLMDYQKALINSAGWGLTVTLAPNIKVLEWFVRRFFLIKKNTHGGGAAPCKQALKTPEQQPSDAQADARCQKCCGSSLKTRHCAVCVGIWADRRGW